MIVTIIPDNSIPKLKVLLQKTYCVLSYLALKTAWIDSDTGNICFKLQNCETNVKLQYLRNVCNW